MIGVESLLFTESRVGVICGVDEAGRGPLFGDVVAAAVILNPSAPIEGSNIVWNIQKQAICRIRIHQLFFLELQSLVIL